MIKKFLKKMISIKKKDIQRHKDNIEYGKKLSKKLMKGFITYCLWKETKLRAKENIKNIINKRQENE